MHLKTYRVWAAAIGLVLSMLWCICPCAAMEGTADIAETYKSYIYDQRGNPVAAPELYRFIGSVSGESLGLGALSKPADLFTDRNGDIYLADSGNHRILIMDSRLRLEQVIDQVLIDGVPESLNNPQGVFVTADGDIYIADTGHARVLAMRRDGSVFRIYTKPTEAVFPQQTEFSPYKIALDRAGSLYVVCHNVFQGLVSYDAQGTFTGFFGSNPVELTWSQLVSQIWKNIFTQEQVASMQKSLPVEYANVYIGTDNFIYTATRSTQNSLDEIKKMNALGNNVLQFDDTGVFYKKNDFGDLKKGRLHGNTLDSRFEDVFTDENGLIYALDSERCRVFIYDKECDLLGIVSGAGDQGGTTRVPSAVEKTGEQLLILDRDKGAMSVFVLTDYGRTLLEARELYQEGNYEDSLRLWQEVKCRNANLPMTYRSMGKIYYMSGAYSQAMEQFKLCEDREGYSQAYREIRKDFVRKNLLWMFLGGILVLFLINRLVAWFLVYTGARLRPERRRRHD